MDWDMLSARLKDERGTVSIVVVLFMVLLISFAAFAIDVGYMMVGRNQLQNIADTAALAAAGELGAIYTSPTYTSLSYSARLSFEPDRIHLLAAAQAVAGSTGISGVTIRSEDFRLGIWNPGGHTFIPAAIRPTAVKVIARKDNLANDPFSTLLAGVLGIGSFNVSATATASLTGPSAVPPPDLPLPVGISIEWFDHEDYCEKPIMLYSSGTTHNSSDLDDGLGCAAWHTYDQSPASASQLQTILGGLTNGTYQSPLTIAGITSFNFTNGTAASAMFNDKNGKGTIGDLFDAMKVKNDGEFDRDTDSSTWTTTIPVYNQPCSDPPNGELTIVGFSTIVITSIAPPPDNTIWAHVVCDSIVSGTGGNGLPTLTGTLGTIPNLVQ